MFLKMNVLFLLIAVSVFTLASCQMPRGTICKPSPYTVQETLDRLTNILEAKGFTIMARVDHAANAANVGEELRPTQLLIFGNPAIGTKFMLKRQTIGLDLPQKALAFQDASGRTQLAYNDPAYLVARHHIADLGPVVAKVTGALNNLTNAATAIPTSRFVRLN